MISAQEIESHDTNTSVPTLEKGDNDSRGDKSAEVEFRNFAPRRGLIFGLVLLVFIVFANSLQGDFVHDDREQIVGNELRMSPDTVVRVFVNDFWASLRGNQTDASIDSIYYRPLFSFFLMIGLAVAGKAAMIWHLIVILLHCASTILAFCVLEKSIAFVSALKERERSLLAGLAAGIFAIHPAQVESVAWISGLVNPLSGALVLATAYVYIKYRESNRVGLLTCALVLFALAVLAKENSVVLVLIVAAYELVAFSQGESVRSRVRSAIFRVIPFACVAASYFAVRYSVLKVLLGRSLDNDFPDDAALTLADNLRTLPALVAGYLKIAFFPIDLSMIYDQGYVKSLSATSFWLPLLLLASITALIVYLSSRMPELKLAAIWIVIPLLPHLNTRAFVSDEIMHDRYLYLSLVGVGLLVTTLIFKAVQSISASTYALAVPAAAVFALLSFATIAQNRVWRSDSNLWRNAARHAPNSRIVRLAIGTLAEHEQDFDGALREYESVLAIEPDAIDGLNHAAFIYARQRRWTEAIRNFERIVAITPRKAIAHFNLSFAYAVQKRYGDAAREQRAAIDLDPNGPRADEWRARLVQLEKTMTTSSIANPR